MLSSKTLRLIIVLAIITISGISIIQVYWVQRAFNLENDQFNRDVNQALFNVTSSIFTINDNTQPNVNPIEQLSSNYYVVTVNQDIDAPMLEYLLKTEFEKRNITADFEYGIYDCTSQKMLYGNYVSFDAAHQTLPASTLPVWDKDAYYFGVYFPSKERVLINRLGIWVFSSVVLLLVVAFFSYALFIILKQKRLSEVQKDFINNMTHEFKTPISTISISSEALKSPSIVQSPERLLNYASIIQMESNRLKNQVDRVLQMASLTKNGFHLKRGNWHFNTLMTQVQESMQPQLEERNVVLDVQLRSEDDSIEVDKLHFSNILFNLLDNAIKYSKQQPVITLTFEKNSTHFEVGVQDQGIGISETHKKHIFEKFYRVPTGNKHDVKGFGLGLHYVHLATKAHGGKIQVDSNSSGTSFKLIFPLR